MRYPLGVFVVALTLFVTAIIILSYMYFVVTDNESPPPASAIATTHSLPSHPQVLPTGQPSTPPFVNATTTSPTKPPHKTILFWGTYFERSWQHVPDEITCSDIYSCSLTTNVDKYLNSDAVLYHGRSVVSNVAPLDTRPRGQIWIYYNQESPPHMGSFTGTPNIINWTLTYISSADVHHYYGGIRPGKFQGGFDPTKNYLEGKTKTAAAMISNCVGHRMEYISKISKYIDIKVYGGCGDQHLCKDCFWNTSKPYKFYLAFENNYCKDYITEKFYRNALLHGIVPVTINGADLTNPKVAPPGSYIDATKFSSAKQLADFLRTEGSDPEHYNKYFRWYSTHDVVDGTDYSFYCDLCEAVHHAEKKQNMYKDVVAWYRKAGECSTYPSIS